MAQNRTQPMATIERIAGITPEEFASRDTPVILAGAVRHWRAVQQWSPEYLKRLMGQVPIRYKLSSSASHPDFHQDTLGKMFARGESRFDEFIDFITQAPHAERSRRLFTGDEQFILQNREGKSTLNDALRPLWEDVEVPPLFARERLYTVWGWFSGPGVRTWLHYDNNACHNLNAQITGRKRCRLFAPEHLAGLYPFPLGGKNPAHNCSMIDVDAPEPSLFPAFADVPSWDGELEAGDLLFIPAFWFHTFFHEGEFNSNVNFWWKPDRPTSNPVAEWQAAVERAASSPRS
jgi:hypothetical protein